MAWALFQLALPRLLILDSATIRTIHLAFGITPVAIARTAGGLLLQALRHGVARQLGPAERGRVGIIVGDRDHAQRRQTGGPAPAARGDLGRPRVAAGVPEDRHARVELALDDGDDSFVDNGVIFVDEVTWTEE